jgi:AraC-like DNA-binding protein
MTSGSASASCGDGSRPPPATGRRRSRGCGASVVSSTRSIVGGTDLARLALDVGYADQAHLTRETTRLAGLPPVAFMRTR